MNSQAVAVLNEEEAVLKRMLEAIVLLCNPTAEAMAAVYIKKLATCWASKATATAARHRLAQGNDVRAG